MQYVPHAPSGYHGSARYFYARIVDVCIGAHVVIPCTSEPSHCATLLSRLLTLHESMLCGTNFTTGNRLAALHRAGLVVVVGVEIFILPWCASLLAFSELTLGKLTAQLPDLAVRCFLCSWRMLLHIGQCRACEIVLEGRQLSKLPALAHFSIGTAGTRQRQRWKRWRLPSGTPAPFWAAFTTHSASAWQPQVQCSQMVSAIAASAR